MKTDVKRISRIAAFVLCAALALVAGFQLAYSQPVYAKGVTAANGGTYYYEELKSSTLAQKFYGAMREMEEGGLFKEGKNEYNLIEKKVLTESEVKEYVDGGSPKIPVALGAARDAFLMDNPDLFYLDVYKIYLSAGMQNGKYVAFLGTGNADNYYADNTVKSFTEVAAAQEKYEAALSSVVGLAKAAGADAVSQIKAVNKYLAENTEYDYGARDDILNGVIVNDGYVSSSYGPLVNKKAICGGFSRAFKAVMDRLDIPCVLVAGSLLKKEGGMAPHMWNAVQLDGLWYGVDVTQNSAAVSVDKYLLVGDDILSLDHFEDGVISTSGFELKYPILRPLEYGRNVDESGFEFKDSGSVGSVKFGDVETAGIHTITLGISFEGKNFIQLRENGKHFAYRSKIDGKWSGWMNLFTVIDSYWLNGDYESDYAKEYLNSMIADKYTIHYVGNEVEKVQFAVFATAPKEGFTYTDAEAAGSNVIAMSTEYSNNFYGDSDYIPAPYAKSVTPNETGYIKKFDPIEITITYNEELVPADGSEFNGNYKIVLDVQGNIHGDMSKYTTVENLRYDPSSGKLSFTFTPSKTYSHNCETYTFVPANLKGKSSLKTPDPAGYLAFKMKQVICPKVFNDGRLYMQVYGQPQFVSADDESMKGFTDENGQPIVGDQRSQLMLVVNEPTKKEQSDMKDALLDKNNGLNLEEKDIKASSTYQIDLQMCGLVQKVPDGSYMKVGFGFPEGYGPDDAGVTFTVYHYRRDKDGKITAVDEVPCVITEYGIIATVESFSPFMICAVDSGKASANKGIYAYANGEGGKISTQKVTSVKPDETVEYTITANDGYEVNTVTLNGKDIKEKVADGALSLSYDDLANNNELEVTFIAKSVKTYREQNNLQIVSPRYVVTQADMIQAVAHDESAPKKGLSGGAIAAIVIACVAVVGAGAGVALYFILKNRKGGGNNKKGGKKKSAKTTRPSSGSTAKSNVKAAPPQPSARTTPPQSAVRSAPTRTAPPQGEAKNKVGTASSQGEAKNRVGASSARPTGSAARTTPPQSAVRSAPTRTAPPQGEAKNKVGTTRKPPENKK